MGDQINGLLSPYLRKQRIRSVQPYLQGTSRVLDFGCGIGVLAESLSPDRYLGVDRDRISLEIARQQHPEHKFLTLEAFLKRSDQAFDLVVALALIEHLSDPKSWIGQMASRLEAGGQIVLTTPHPKYIWLHEIGARVGLCSSEAVAEHNEFFDFTRMTYLASTAGLSVRQYSRFLFGANQLFVLA